MALLMADQFELGAAPCRQGLTRMRARASVAVHAAVLAAAVPVLWLLAPASRWDHPALLGALVAIAVVANLSQVLLRTGIRLDAGIALAFIALALAGPLPAIAVLVADDLVRWALRRDTLLRAGALANFAAYAWMCLAGAGVLALADAAGPSLAALPVLLAAGAVMVLVNYAVGPMIYGTLYLRRPVRVMAAQLTDVLPPVAAVVGLGAATAALTGPFGVFALVSFGAIVLVPQLALPLGARSLLGAPRAVAELEPVEATVLYAQALGDALGYDRRDRRILAAAAELVDTAPWGALKARGCLEATWSQHDASEITYAVFHSGERYDGGGVPAGLEATAIPVLARVLAVARTWAALTARGTAQLSHQHALLDLQARTVGEFDPIIVDAAGVIVAAEAALAGAEPAAQPRRHALPLPRALRHGTLLERVAAVA